jgi:hypothetical protein
MDLGSHFVKGKGRMRIYELHSLNRFLKLDITLTEEDDYKSMEQTDVVFELLRKGSRLHNPYQAPQSLNTWRSMASFASRKPTTLKQSTPSDGSRKSSMAMLQKSRNGDTVEVSVDDIMGTINNEEKWASHGTLTSHGVDAGNVTSKKVAPVFVDMPASTVSKTSAKIAASSKTNGGFAIQEKRRPSAAILSAATLMMLPLTTNDDNILSKNQLQSIILDRNEDQPKYETLRQIVAELSDTHQDTANIFK